MKSCEHYQAQLLEHLYGLLEAEDSLALIEHAGQCDICRAALLKADSQRQLLSAAAVTEFPNVRFQEPAEEPATLPIATPVARSARARAPLSPRMPRHPRRWVAAAAALLAIAGLGWPAIHYASEQREHRDEVDESYAGLNNVLAEERKFDNERTAAVNQAEQAVKSAKDQIADLARLQEKELDTLAKQQLYMVVTGQQALRPGVPSEYRIETRNLKDEPVDVRLDVRVRDLASGKIVKEESVPTTQNGVHTFELSPDATLKAGSQLALEVVARSDEGPQRGELSEKLTLAKRSYLTQLATDRPMYRPGETVRFRSLTLDRYSLRPPSEDLRLIYTLSTLRDGQEFQVALYDENGKEIAQFQNDQKVFQLVRDARVILQADEPVLNGAGTKLIAPRTPVQQPQVSLRGIGAGAFALPEQLPGGEYSLQVKELDNKFPPEKRKFIVHKYQPPTMNKKLENFHKSAYGAGDEVVALLKVAKVEGGTPLGNQPVVATVRVDGKNYKADGSEAKTLEESAIEGATDAAGEVKVRFKLPATIERGDATLSVDFTDGAAHEALSKPIPVVVNKLNLDFYPEGGYLVAGVPNRVYFQARTPLDKPAEVNGHLLDGDNQTVAVLGLDGAMADSVQTLHDEKPGINQGMGAFTFTPKAGVRYRLVVDKPEKIEGKFELPEVKPDGVVLSVPTGFTNDRQPITAVVHSADRDRELLVGAYCRGVLLDQHALKAKAGAVNEVKLTPSGNMGGVYRITVFEKQPPNANDPYRPVAERLVYREPAQRLNITITGKKVNAPGDHVTLTLKTNSESGQPLPTVLLVGVVDKSVITMADERTARSLPTHFMLTSEVRRPEDLEFADVLLTDNVQARKALDLLLGTQGWRRFVESDPGQFKKAPAAEGFAVQPDVQRLLVAGGMFSSAPGKGGQAVNTVALEKERVVSRYKQQFDELEAQEVSAEVALDDARENAEAAEQKQALHDRAEKSRSSYAASLAGLRDFDDHVHQLRQNALLVFGLVLLLAGAGSLAVGLVRQAQRALPVYAAAMGAVGLCGMMVLGTYLLETQAPGPVPVAAAKVSAPELGDGKDNDDMDRPKEFGLAAPRPDAGGGAGDGGVLKLAPQAEREKNNDPKKPPMEERAPVPPAAKPVDEGAHADPNAKHIAGQPVLNNKEAEHKAAKDARTGGPARPGETTKGKQTANVPMAPGLMAPEYRRFEMLQKRYDNMGFGRTRTAQEEALEATDAFKKIEQAIRKADEVKERDADHMDDKAKNELQIREVARQQVLAAATPTVARAYAHQNRADKKNAGGLRSDFSETLYWHPALVLPNGEAKIEFDLSDGERSFEVFASGHAGDGRLGATTYEIESHKPFSLAATVPGQVVASDTIDLPVFVRNNTDQARRVRVALELTNLKTVSGSESGLRRELNIKPKDRVRVVFQLQPKMQKGIATVAIHASAEPFGSDSIAYNIEVLPEGFPINKSHSDLLENKGAEHAIALPREWVKGTLQCELNVYPSRMADLQQGLAALLREPNGCFEQTSSSNYPNLLVLDYMQKTGQEDEAARARATNLLTNGYSKLVAFECRKPGGDKRQGYEWFGGEAPPHEALTAYGLMEFADMARVGQPVDPAMVKRTRDYLLSCRDKQGGFTRNQRAIDTFGQAPQHLTNAYIVWALTETDEKARDEMKPELEALIKGAKDSKDPYYLALVANSLLNCKMFDEAAPVLKKLAEAQKKPDGYLDGAETSITRSGGRDLQIESTALAVLAWLKTPRPHNYEQCVSDAVNWIGKQRSGQGGFGSTQSTILALKALIAHTVGKPSKVEPGEIALVVNGKRVSNALLDAGRKETLTLKIENAEALLQAGQENKIEIVSTSGSNLPYTLSWSYQTVTPENVGVTPIKLTTKLNQPTALDGQTVHLSIEVENTTASDQGMVTAVIGLPSGLSLPDDFAELKKLTRSSEDGKVPARISHWEIRDRELVLYWRGLKANQKVDLELALNCRVPGTYRGAASRAYLYYNADQKCWIEPVKVEVKTGAEK